MKKIICLALTVLAAAQGAWAQGFIVSGQVTDAKGKPVKKADVKITNGDKVVMATTDKDGLYHSSEVEPGTYDVTIFNDYAASVSTAKITIAPTDPKKRFYNFKVQGMQATLAVSDKDIFMETACAKVRNNPDMRIDVPQDKFMYISLPKNIDTTR